MYYSLLITISSFLITSIWKDRNSALKRGDEVTVEPHDQSFHDNVHVVQGSYFAVVDQESPQVGSCVMCTVRRTDGQVSLVKREYLRHRKWYRIAFLQVTNDKKHDCWSSQAFACRRLEFYDIFHKKGLEEALKFALNDEAETERKDALMVQNTRSVSAVAGTATSGASIQGQAVSAVVTDLRDARAPADQQPRRKRCDVSEEEFERRHALVQDEIFWAWLQGTDNATHFKSKENLNFWSERRQHHSEWLKMVWVAFGCPGHGKGPWDGLGAMVKTKVTLNIIHDKERTMKGKITSPTLVPQPHYFRALESIMHCFPSNFWRNKITNSKESDK